jgi:hypothetical protein
MLVLVGRGTDVTSSSDRLTLQPDLLKGSETKVLLHHIKSRPKKPNIRAAKSTTAVEVASVVLDLLPLELSRTIAVARSQATSGGVNHGAECAVG